MGRHACTQVTECAPKPPYKLSDYFFWMGLTDYPWPHDDGTCLTVAWIISTHYYCCFCCLLCNVPARRLEACIRLCDWHLSLLNNAAIKERVHAVLLTNGSWANVGNAGSGCSGLQSIPAYMFGQLVYQVLLWGLLPTYSYCLSVLYPSQDKVQNGKWLFHSDGFLLLTSLLEDRWQKWIYSVIWALFI